jgi:hypothetical protein
MFSFWKNPEENVHDLFRGATSTEEKWRHDVCWSHRCSAVNYQVPHCRFPIRRFTASLNMFLQKSCTILKYSGSIFSRMNCSTDLFSPEWIAVQFLSGKARTLTSLALKTIKCNPNGSENRFNDSSLNDADAIAQLSEPLWDFDKTGARNLFRCFITKLYLEIFFFVIRQVRRACNRIGFPIFYETLGDLCQKTRKYKIVESEYIVLGVQKDYTNWSYYKMYPQPMF